MRLMERVVTLSFTEIVIDALDKNRAFSDNQWKNLMARIDKWLEKLWIPIRSANIDQARYRKIHLKIANEIKALETNYTPEALMTAVLMLVEDMHSEAPEGAKHNAFWLLVAVSELYSKFIEPEFGDPGSVLQDHGQTLGEKIRSLA